MQRTVQEICGLGGVLPCSNDKIKWGGTVQFNREIGLAKISYASQSITNKVENLTILSRTFKALEQFILAASEIQTAGQCCDCLSVFVHRIETNVELKAASVELCRLEFQHALSLSKGLKRLLESPEPSSSELENTYKIALKIIDILYSAEQLLSGHVTLDNVVHICAIAVQFLCVGLLSYSQAHISPLQPFFLDLSLAEIQLLGSEEPDSLAISAYLVQLSCIGEMTKERVIVFTSSLSPLLRNVGAKYDVLASVEDFLDTFGPGQLIFPKFNPIQPCAVSVRGGLITAKEGGSGLFHWGRDLQPHASLKSFDPTTKILIGVLAEVNVCCTINEERCRKHVTLEPLGTTSESWDLRERQYGVQGGYFVIGVYNSTYCKIAGTSLKERLLHKADDMLLLDLEDSWGVQVSFCTGVARRVPMRTLLADVLPIFAQADALTKSYWEDLERNDNIVGRLRLPKFIEFVGQLHEDLRRYLIGKIRGTLDVLRHTGIDKDQNHFTVAWPYGNDVQRGIRIACEKESYWTRMLADTLDCATFAYISLQCLESRQYKCSGTTPGWQNSAKLLVTAVSLHPGVEDTPSPNSASYSVRQWKLCHKEQYHIGTNDLFLKFEVHRPSASACALLRPKGFKVPFKYRMRIAEKVSEKLSSGRRLREKQKPEDIAENILVACNIDTNI